MDFIECANCQAFVVPNEQKACPNCHCPTPEGRDNKPRVVVTDTVDASRDDNPYRSPTVAKSSESNVEFFIHLPKNCPVCNAAIDVNTRRFPPRLTKSSILILVTISVLSMVFFLALPICGNLILPAILFAAVVPFVYRRKKYVLLKCWSCKWSQAFFVRTYTPKRFKRIAFKG
jgi:hypothetical protein